LLLVLTARLATSTLPTTTTSVLGAHLGAELLKLGLLVGSQDIYDRLTKIPAIRYGGAELLNLLLLGGGQPQLVEHLLHVLTALPPFGGGGAGFWVVLVVSAGAGWLTALVSAEATGAGGGAGGGSATTVGAGAGGGLATTVAGWE
jgi:hypothetical protein